MITKSDIKFVKSLHFPKFRQIHNKFITEGEKVCIEILQKESFRIHAVYHTKDVNVAGSKVMKNILKSSLLINEREMEQISALTTPTSILCVFEKTEIKFNETLKDIRSVIFLDRIQDPGNMGTIIRIADWFGIEMVVRSPESADFFNPKVVQATMGSIANVHLITSNIAEVIKFYPSKAVYGTFMQGENIFENPPADSSILVIGNEGKGISADTEKFVHHKISIPGSPDRVADSLNAGVAAGIICSIWKFGTK
ncbi:MAG: RNA methyltransferase [Saprospiraceae bacterium]|nr:RNA methyltransferase [Saprospiraceae bacterium]